VSRVGARWSGSERYCARALCQQRQILLPGLLPITKQHQCPELPWRAPGAILPAGCPEAGAQPRPEAGAQPRPEAGAQPRTVARAQPRTEARTEGPGRPTPVAPRRPRPVPPVTLAILVHIGHQRRFSLGSPKIHPACRKCHS
jgi:hypothetical protein